jgi:hypothetical protein
MPQEHHEQIDQLVALLDSLPVSGSNPKLAIEEDTLRLSSPAGGAVAYLLLLAVVLGPPAWLLYDEPDTTSYLIALGWFLIFGRIWLALALSDIETTIHLRDETIATRNVSPPLGWLRKVFPFRLRWEGEYRWSEVTKFSVEYKVYSKTLSGYSLMLTTLDGRKAPVCQFEKQNTAWSAAKILTGLLRLPSPD